jgi:16S rRNA (guanine966-N2)-methyltransferase
MEDRYGKLVRYNTKEFGDKYLSLFCHEDAIGKDTEE